jgi:hypothetical protein
METVIKKPSKPKVKATKDVPLEVGQTWQLPAGRVQIVSLGKVLVHYKYFRLPQQRGVHVQIQSQREMIESFRRQEAKLIDPLKPAKTAAAA